MTINLFKTAKEFNISTIEIVETLLSNGFEIDNKPNAKISMEMFDLLNIIYKTTKIEKILRLERLSRTKVLNLGNCFLTEWPQEIFAMTWLETLILGDNTIWNEEKEDFIQNQNLIFENRNLFNFIPNEISQLENLKHFSIGGDYEKKYPINYLGGLIQCKNIEVLDLSFCEILNLKGVEKFKKLKKLDLSRNKISSINTLVKLGKLESLNLFENQIHSFQILINNIDFINQLEYLNIKSNPNIDELFDIDFLNLFGDNIEKIIELVEDENNGQLIKYSIPHKVIFLGNSNTGKTSLARTLIQDEKQFPEGEESTHGLKIRDWRLGKEFNNKKVFIYDFGGQDFYHSIYNMFFTWNTIYVVLWNDHIENHFVEAKSEKDLSYNNYNVEYWLGNVKYWLRRGSEVNSRKDESESIRVIPFQNQFNTFEKHCDALYKNFNYGTQYSLNLNIKSPLNIAKVKLFTHEISNILDHYNDTMKLSKNDTKIVEKILQKIYNHNNYLLLQLNLFYKEYGSPENSVLLQRLHSRGMVIFLPHIPQLSNFIWINPSTVSAKIYKILSRKEIQNGQIIETKFDSIIDEQLKQLLLHQEIIFIDTSSETHKIIIPQYLPLSPTDDLLLDFASSDLNEGFSIKFHDYMPHGMMTRIICRLGKNPGQKHYYRYEIICRLPLEFPNFIKIRIKTDMLKLTLDVKMSFNKNSIVYRDLVYNYLFKTILAAYWNEEHKEIIDDANNIQHRLIKDEEALYPVWQDTQFFRFTKFDFSISLDNEWWVDYSKELIIANIPSKDNILLPIIESYKNVIDDENMMII